MAKQEAANPKTKPAAPHKELSTALVHVGLLGSMKAWMFEQGPWWLCSFVFHSLLVCSLALVSGKVIEKVVDEAPAFEEADLPRQVEVPQEIERFEVAQTPQDPTELNTETLSMDKPAEISQEEKLSDKTPTFGDKGGGVAALASNEPNLGGLGGFDLKGFGIGEAAKGKGGVGVGVGTGIHPGVGGDESGFSVRTGRRKALLASGGGTRQSERAVAGALNWLAAHQSPDGSWNLVAYKARCKDGSCTGSAKIGDQPTAATAMALLPFFAAGQTHESKGRYKKTIYAGVAYLISHQKKDGDLRGGGSMYNHGLASIALCECYGMSGDRLVGRAAQAALNFIMEAQDPVGGGWRDEPRTPGDTSVAGWQLMALKSGQMAYLSVHPAVFDRAKHFLKTVSAGTPGTLGIGGLFKYMPDSGPTPPLTAVGLLCSQYMGTPRTDPAMVEGTAVLMQNQPNPGARNLYYWYYATQVMHNQPGPDWDTWNRKMRHTLIDSQCKDGNCAAGSWDPDKPLADAWGDQAGRIYMTSLSALTLEVYYRYLPLYKLDSGGEEAPAKPAADKPAKKPTRHDNVPPARKAAK